MKYIYLIILPVLLFSCSKQGESKVTIEKNCTGTYIKTSNKTYLVCNDQDLPYSSSGDEVTLKYKLIDKCDSHMDRIICMLYFEHDGIVEIEI